MARLGIGILIIPQKPWDVVAQELNAYRSVFHQVNGTDAPAPVVGGWTFCDENEERAAELGRKYIGEYWRSVVRHYELIGTHLTTMKGYEAYKDLQERASAEGGVDEMIEFFLSLQVWGTPQQCFEKILDIRRRTGTEHFNAVFSYGAMPYDIAEHSMRLFAAEVLPELKRLAPVDDQLAREQRPSDADAYRLAI
jgi:alkanesulfonate monooxygenase SsuD/methylene tetrahydromethanopterin reductase-like flavin-dependent oxidoreductase (luciferase family)